MAITLTYTFSANTTISSSQVNANFSTLATRALDKTGDTMTGDLKFTDASFDIGKTGATRPRDFFLSRNATIGGTSTFADDLIFSADKYIRRSTADASDNGLLTLCGGGGTTTTRGAQVEVNGNESSSPGYVVLRSGDVANAVIRFRSTTGAINTDIDGTTGLITIGSGQIAFPSTQNPSSNANTLDDYKEGAWTPVIGGSGGTSGQVYSNQNGYFIKNGKQVTVWFDVSLSTKGTITGNAQLQGFPYPVENSTGIGGAAGIVWLNLATTWVSVMVQPSLASSAGTIVGTAVAAVTNNTILTTADFGNTSRLIGTCTYRATT